MSKNTVLGYLKGDFQLFLLFSYESLKRLTVPYVRCLVSINTLAGRAFSRHTIYIYYANFLLFSYFLQLLKTLFYQNYYSVPQTLFYKRNYNVPSQRPTTTAIDTFYIYASELEIFSFAGFSKHVRIYLIFRKEVHDFFQSDSYVFFFGTKMHL